MTKKARQREKGLLAPKRPARSRAFRSDYGHMLDSTIEEIMPAQMPDPVDQPTRRADHVLLTGPLAALLAAIIDAALAHSGALNTDEDPAAVLREATGITAEEYDAVLERSENRSWERIAHRNGTTPAHARELVKEGLKKLRRFVNT